ncbi:flagellum site-determining protein YlxH [Weizmannia acidilactici]|uniref:Flagellum site-determining protein YlxH n=1 Tax=Weizmannia acidilactici TaxID=2607726 RepID=A0A5J4JFC2_9BACI|nr:MinD/ParA family protein [Weizmannia acidilactici]GER65642.1 flagellum site-determining protein YlxH [Weizmannia acidilactici]GER69028.1 flagellum site-determining protein YlxH [Weizmannia acidilactici]GER71999.1 flagellum site-determining protein YlxH [Weizmannia acidilactici]
MRDQAEQLRAKLKMQYGQPAKTFAVASGKGGVGKSNISVNMAMALAKQGKKVLLFDLDIGMGNIHVLLGLDAPYTISDFINREMSLSEIMCKGPNGISYISAGNGFAEIIQMEEAEIEKLVNELELLQYDFDYIIFDMGAGAAPASLEILLSADDIFIVTTPEPTAITDAYSMIKYICMQRFDSALYLICNRAEKEKDGILTLNRLQYTVKKFLQKEVEILGVVPEDSNVKKAVSRQLPFYDAFPHSSAAKKIDALLESYLNGNFERPTTRASVFVRKLKGLWLKN